MSRKHKTQHKQEREERKSKEMQDLKRDNHKLEKQVARLRKQLAKTVTESEEAEEAAQEMSLALPVPVGSSPCCIAEIKRVAGPGKVYLFCGKCKTRIGEEAA